MSILQMKIVLFERLKNSLTTIVKNVKEGTTIRSDSLETISDALQPIKMLGSSFNDRELNTLIAEAETQINNLQEKKQLEEEMKAQPLEAFKSRIAILEEETNTKIKELGEALEEKTKELETIKSRWQI